MTQYKIYQSAAGELHKVKIGFSFPGFFFGGLWMLVARLWDIFALGLIAAIIFAVLVELLFHPPYMLFPGCLVWGMIAGIYGNGWIERRLRKSGYSLIHDTRSVEKKDVDAPEGSLIAEVWRGNTSAALRMIESGADINQTNSAGETALDAASIRGDISTVLMLLSKGAEGRLA